MENLPLLRCLAVDDEPFALQLIQDDLKRLPGVELVRAVSSAQEAEAVLRSREVDLMFLDIQMPGITGMQFLRSLTSPPWSFSPPPLSNLLWKAMNSMWWTIW